VVELLFLRRQLYVDSSKPFSSAEDAHPGCSCKAEQRWRFLSNLICLKSTRPACMFGIVECKAHKSPVLIAARVLKYADGIQPV
jgi:hypothetical protein